MQLSQVCKRGGGGALLTNPKANLLGPMLARPFDTIAVLPTDIPPRSAGYLGGVYIVLCLCLSLRMSLRLRLLVQLPWL